MAASQRQPLFIKAGTCDRRHTRTRLTEAVGACCVLIACGTEPSGPDTVGGGALDAAQDANCADIGVTVELEFVSRSVSVASGTDLRVGVVGAPAVEPWSVSVWLEEGLVWYARPRGELNVPLGSNESRSFAVSAVEPGEWFACGRIMVPCNTSAVCVGLLVVDPPSD